MGKRKERGRGKVHWEAESASGGGKGEDRKEGVEQAGWIS